MSTIADVAQVLGGPTPYKSKHEYAHWTTLSGTRWTHIAMHTKQRPIPDEAGFGKPRRYRAVRRMMNRIPDDSSMLAIKNIISILILALGIGLACGAGMVIVLNAFGY